MNDRIESALRKVTRHLIGEMNAEGYWEGRLSSSALSTATAVSALSLAGESKEIIRAGAKWLAETRNPDGGWGDTPDSPSNLSTTLLAKCALRLCPQQLTTHNNSGTKANDIVRAVRDTYGSDRTFAVPILMNCALAGLVSWRDVPGLPFELAVFPRGWYRALRLQVVSYALPALIAVGLVIHRHAPSRNPIVRLARDIVTRRVLKKLATLQPENGGFLEATPLTSFVAMSLIPVLGKDHPVARKCLDFIKASQREDGSWPIDTNLSVWLTTGAVNALANANAISEIDIDRTRAWIAERQYTETHPFTGATPGGWSWTHLPGGVPDGDDTSGAIIALAEGVESGGWRVHDGWRFPNPPPFPFALSLLSRFRGSGMGGDFRIPLPSRNITLAAGVKWLLKLQNPDGGWPTFCRGWGRLPFDRSSPDITAHALRALRAADPDLTCCRGAVRRGFGYLATAQNQHGAWSPLWFGNQSTPDKSNPVFGTARVIPAYIEHKRGSVELVMGIQYLLRSQNNDGGWGGGAGVFSTVEETAVAVSALSMVDRTPEVSEALTRGTNYLVEAVESERYFSPSPIGLYFASLWYSEKLYPVIWTVEALGRAREWGSRE